MICLNSIEASRCCMEGSHRRLRAILKRRAGFDRARTAAEWASAWGWDIEALAAEVVVAKHLGVYQMPTASTDRHRGDVLGFEVRYSMRDDADLLVYEHDGDDRLIALVVGRMPCYRVAGWGVAGEFRAASEPSTMPSGDAAWRIPQTLLRTPRREAMLVAARGHEDASMT